MGLTINQMRGLISEVYSGKKWAAKVAHMDDGQVIAIYNDFLKKGKFEKKPGKRPLRPKKEKPVTTTDYTKYSSRQISIFDEGVR